MSDETGTPQQDSILEAATTIALHCGRSIPEASDYRVVANAYAREIERLRGDLSETRIALANAECRERVAKARLAEAVQYAEQLRDFAQWLTGCGYDFTQHEYFVANRHLLAARATDSATPRENV